MDAKYLNKIVRGISSEEYHGMNGTYSSSQLKDLLEDDGELFYQKYIAKTIEREEIPAFSVGTFFHTAVLEPELLEKECAVYRDGVRRGAKWDKFKEDNKGKTIITETEEKQCQGLVEAVRNSKIAMKYIEWAEPEVSAFVSLLVKDGEIYHLLGDGDWLMLYPTGWAPAKKAPTGGIIIVIKVRADSISFDEEFISDLKSTTGNVRNVEEMKKKVSNYNYDLSAALYLDVFSVVYKPIKHFIWIFASKDNLTSKTWVADEENIMIGRAKWKEAVVKLSRAIKNKWQFEDTLGVLGPSYWERTRLKQSDADLL